MSEALYYDAEDDPFGVVELAVATFDAPDDRMGFMTWAVLNLRSVDPRRLLSCKFRFNLGQGVCEFVCEGKVFARHYPKGWQ